MATFKTIAKLLGLKELKVTAVSFHRERVVRLAVKPFKNGCRCPQCGRRGTIVRQRPRLREWRDIPVGGWSVFLLYAPREVRCPTHGRVEERIPWAERGARVTRRYEYVMLRYCQMMTQKAAALLLRVSPSTLSEQLHRSIERHREGHRIRELRLLGIDEVSYRKGHKYATLVYDLERAVVLWVGQGKARESIDAFFEQALSTYQKAQVRAACCDMSETYIGAIQHHCPNAKLVLDRFHVVKAINDALDEVRKEQWRVADASERKALKGLRWLLYRHSSTRSRRDTRTLQALERGNRRIYRAWRLKDEFEQFWNYKAPWAAERFLKRWTTTALRSRLAPMKKLVATLRKYQDGILAFVNTRLTNAVSEGLNRIVKIVKNRASGFRDLPPFADMIYLTVGDLDIPAQIPRRFRTL
jgi:transposase